jgi:DNA-binding NarL/FixJ family response regulator
MIRVLLADDQSLIRAGFRMILKTERDIDVVGEASDGREAVAQADALTPDVVLMDIRMPGLDGIEATRQITAGNSGRRVLVLTTFDLDEYVYESLRAGASAFLLKTQRSSSSSLRSASSPTAAPCSPPRSPGA